MARPYVGSVTVSAKWTLSASRRHVGAPHVPSGRFLPDVSPNRRCPALLPLRVYARDHENTNAESPVRAAHTEQPSIKPRAPTPARPAWLVIRSQEILI